MRYTLGAKLFIAGVALALVAITVALYVVVN